MLSEADRKFIRETIKAAEKRITMAVTAEFTQALNDLVTAAIAKGVAQAALDNSGAVAAATTQAQADDLAAVQAAAATVAPQEAAPVPETPPAA